MISLEIETQKISEELLSAARRLPSRITNDFELACTDSIDLTEQGVRDIIASDMGKMYDMGLISQRTGERSNQIFVDDRHTIPVHAFKGGIRQTSAGVEVDVIAGEPPRLYRNAFLSKDGGIYVRINKRSVRKVADVYIWDWAGPRRLAEQLPETIAQKFGRLIDNTFKLLFGKGSKE